MAPDPAAAASSCGGAAGARSRCTSRTASRSRLLGRAGGRRGAPDVLQQPTTGSSRATIDGRLVGEATFAAARRPAAGLARRWRVGRSPGAAKRPAAARRHAGPARACRPRSPTGRRVGADDPALLGAVAAVVGHWRPGRPRRAGPLERARTLGAGFVLVNPLHAAAPMPPVEPSPYLPATRRFVSPLYLRVEAVPEYAYLTGAERAEIERTGPRSSGAISASDDPARPRRGLGGEARGARPCARRRRAAPARQADYEAFLEREGARPASTSRPGARSPRCTAPLARLARSRCATRGRPAVAAARDELAERVDFYCWLQWVRRRAARGRAAAGSRVRDGARHRARPRGRRAPGRRRHLGAAGRAGPRRHRRRAAGRVQPAGAGLVAAAVAAGPAGRGGLRARTATCCAPCCGTPAACGSTTSSACSGCGGCRRASRPAEGTYVRYDHEALVGILALEAHRARAPSSSARTSAPSSRGCATTWRERGMLGTSILWFERDYDAGRAAAARAVAGAVPRHRDDARPAADRRLPGRRAHPDPRRRWACSPARSRRSGGSTRPSRPVLAGAARRARAARGRRDARRAGRSSRRCTGAWPRPRPAARRGTRRRRGRAAGDEPAGHRRRSTRTGGCRWPTGAAEPVLLEDLVELPFAAELAAAVRGRRVRLVRFPRDRREPPRAHRCTVAVATALVSLASTPAVRRHAPGRRRRARRRPQRHRDAADLRRHPGCCCSSSSHAGVRPVVARGPRYRPGPGLVGRPVWFNGPDDAEAAVAHRRPRRPDGGGASARW